MRPGDRIRCVMADGSPLVEGEAYVVAWIANGKWLYVEDEHGRQSGGWNLQRFKKIT